MGTRYYFRRAVPRDIQAILGRKEFSLALKTSNKVIARERAWLLYGRIDELFNKAKDAAPEPTKAELKELIALQKKIIAEHEDLCVTLNAPLHNHAARPMKPVIFTRNSP